MSPRRTTREFEDELRGEIISTSEPIKTYQPLTASIPSDWIIPRSGFPGTVIRVVSRS